MKILTLFVFLVLSGQMFGQVKDGGSVFLREAVIDSIPIPKSQLRDKSKEWIGKTFKSGEAVITSETEGSIIGHYTSIRTGSIGHQFVWEHTISIDIKDNKARLKIWVDRIMNGASAAEFWYGKAKPLKVHNRWLEEMMQESKQLTDSYRLFIMQKDEW